MKVGDLVRLMMGHYLLDSKRYSGQLAVIIRYNEAACNPWKVKVISGGEIWLKSHELELV
tara:strand:- start:2135 stop:2314 length:180 start_codon:yes stop_codon:yes gene_type:complete